MRYSLRQSKKADHADVAHNGTPNTFGKDAEHERDASSNSDLSETGEKQAGVKRIEAVSKSWTKTSLIIAYVTYAIIFTAYKKHWTLMCRQTSTHRKRHFS